MGRGRFEAKKRVREGANVAEREAGILFDAPSLAANATPAAACGSTQDDEVGVSNSKLKKKAHSHGLSCLWLCTKQSGLGLRTTSSGHRHSGVSNFCWHVLDVTIVQTKL